MGESTRIPLLGGSYTSASLIANAQVCINLYPETNPQSSQAPAPVTHMLTPGLTNLVGLKNATVRCLYRATNDHLFAVAGDTVYYIDGANSASSIGTITAGTTPVSISDNGSIAVLVDGTANGYTFDIATNAWAVISDGAFYGANRVCFLDGWFVFNKPGTNQFYLSPNYWNGTDPFDPLFIASKTGGADRIISIAVIRGELWLLGAVTTEIWYNAGGADFPFARQPGVFINHGMQGGWSVSENDVEVFWLGRDIQGRLIVFKGAEYQAQRVSNYALEAEFQSYGTVNDTIGFTYQQRGHTFYVLIFPTADKTWVYDVSTDQWHQRQSLISASQHRWRANCFAFGNNITLVGDYTNGEVYQLDPTAFTDAGAAITRQRSFPHLVNGGKRISYDRLIADMFVDAGAAAAAVSVSLDWSDDRGISYGSVLALSFATRPTQGGTPVAGLISLLATRLGMARDRVFRLTWSFAFNTSLNGLWIETSQAET